MTVSRTLVALAAGGVLSAGALGGSPPHRNSNHDRGGSHSRASISISIGGHSSGHYSTGYGRSGGNGHYRSGYGSTHYGSGHGNRVSIHYDSGHSYYRTPTYGHVTVYEPVYYPPVYRAPVYRETYVYRTPVRYESSRVVKVYGSGYDGGYSRPTMEQAWDQLGRGDSRAALRSFSSLAEASPYKALPKVGYALACAERGDLKGAVAAMRRAFAADAEAIHYFPRDERLLALVQNLEYRYIQRSEAAYGNPDYHFMIGALAFLRHDMDRAWVAVNKAQDHRDRSKGTRGLKKVVRKYREDTGDGY